MANAGEARARIGLAETRQVSDVMVLVRKARSDWLRAQCEVAYVRVLMAAQRYADALRREDKYSPTSRACPPAIPTAGNGRIRVAVKQA